jgi:hypothetical protein
VIEEASIPDFLLRIPLIEGKIESGIARFREGTLEPPQCESIGEPHLPSLHRDGESASLTKKNELIGVDCQLTL